MPDRFTEPAATACRRSIHTAGWIRIVDVQADDLAIATMTHACDGMLEGDYLEPFVLPALAAATRPRGGQPDFANPGRIVLGDERRQSGHPATVMVIDRGSDHGLRAGQRLTIFRETAGGSGPIFAWARRP